MMRRLLIAFALLTGCSSPEPPAPDEKVEAPAPEPEAPAPDEPGEASEAMKTALLGGGEEKPTEAEEATADEPEPKPEPRRTKRSSPKQQAERSDRPDRSRTPPPAIPEPPARLSDAEFEGVVGDWQGVKRCVTTNRPRGGQVQNGALSVQFTIAGNGIVEAAQVENASGAFARGLAPCVERKAMRLRFPDFGGKSSVTRSAKFVF